MVSVSTAIKAAFVGVLPVTLAIPAGSPEDKAVQITIEKDFNTSETALSVLHKSTSQVLASSCSNRLALPTLNTTIIADIDKTGSGHLTIGNQAYIVHENVGISGGISCNRVYNTKEVFVICDLPPDYANLPAHFVRRSAPSQDDSSCLKNGGRSLPVPRTLKSHAMAMMKGPGSEPRPNTSAVSIDKRQRIDIPCAQWEHTTEAVENPDPHQNYYLKQLSENQMCGSQSCTVGEIETFSISVDFSVSSGSKANEFADAGFGVSASWSYSESHECNGNPKDTICVWYNTAHTAYTVQNHDLDIQCGGEHVSAPFVMFSPNKNNAGGGFYCVAGTACRTVDSSYWDYSGRAGGP